MRLSNRLTPTSILAIGTLAAFIGLAGCQKTTSAPAAGPAPGMTAPGGPMMQPGAAKVTPINESDPHAAGQKVFVSNGCGRCHQVNGAPGPGVGGGSPMAGPGGPPMAGPGASAGGPGGRGPGGPGGPGGRAPDLGKIGADPEHTVEWLIEFIRDPKSKKPDAHMPPFAGKINDEDMQALAEYLASLTGEAPKDAPEKDATGKDASKDAPAGESPTEK